MAANVLNIHETVDPQPMRLEPFESFWNYEEIVFCPLQFFSTELIFTRFKTWQTTDVYRQTASQSPHSSPLQGFINSSMSVLLKLLLWLYSETSCSGYFFGDIISLSNRILRANDRCIMPINDVTRGQTSPQEPSKSTLRLWVHLF